MIIFAQEFYCYYIMSTYRKLVYLCLDELKLHTDDAYFTEEHIMFLLNKYRVFVLKQRYSDVRKQIPESNYQTICLDLIKDMKEGSICGDSYLRSSKKVPFLMKIGNPMVFPIDYYRSTITYISRERMKYVGYNKYLQNIIYASISPDNYLYLKSSNPQFLHLKKVRVTGIFEDAELASKLQCSIDDIDTCDVLDREFPIEDALIPPLIQLVVEELTKAEYKPEDKENNSDDDLSEVATK